MREWKKAGGLSVDDDQLHMTQLLKNGIAVCSVVSITQTSVAQTSVAQTGVTQTVIAQTAVAKTAVA